MRYALLTGVALVFGMVLAACNSANVKVGQTQTTPTAAPQTETTYADGARRITVAETQELIKNGKAFIVDVRDQGSYDAGHIPGAKLIPAREILNHADELPRDKTIVTYCS